MSPLDSGSGVDSGLVLGERRSEDRRLPNLGVSRAHLGRHQEQLRRPFLPQDQRVFPASQTYQAPSLPFPLNLPPSYPVHSSASSPVTSSRPTRLTRPPSLRQSAPLTPSHISKRSEIAPKSQTRTPEPLSASSAKGKGKGILDVFMDSRQSKQAPEPESSGSDSETSLRQMFVLPILDDSVHGDASALPSSSPPSSSPLRTPKESSPLRVMYGSPSSPTPKAPVRSNASSQPFVLPPGPYSLDKPSWSLAAIIGQALNASYTGTLTLNQIYSYISIVYPHFDRSDASWMSSIRHGLSVNDAFERVPSEEESKGEEGDQGGEGRKGRKGKSKGRGGSWRITPGAEACFAAGNFIRKGAKGAGPGKNQARRKRPRDDEGERSEKKSRAGKPTPSVSSSSLASTSTQHRPRTVQSRPRAQSRSIYSELNDDYHAIVSPTRRPSSIPSLTNSQSTISSIMSSGDPLDLPPSSPGAVEYYGGDSSVAGSPGSPDLPLALVTARRNAAKGHPPPVTPSLEPSFELSGTSTFQSPPHYSSLESRDADVDRDLFTRVLASTSSAHASSQARPPSTLKSARSLFPPLPSPPLAGPSSSPVRPTTPPPRRSGTSPARTPLSHRGLHMSPSRSLAHYKSSLDPEWKAAKFSSDAECRTPPQREPRNPDETVTSTPRKLIFPSAPPQTSPFRTPARSSVKQRHQPGYDPYDPNTVLADELASIRKAHELQESPGGFFGKEGRKLLYESPGVPSRSHWRFRDEL